MRRGRVHSQMSGTGSNSVFSRSEAGRPSSRVRKARAERLLGWFLGFLGRFLGSAASASGRVGQRSACRCQPTDTKGVLVQREPVAERIFSLRLRSLFAARSRKTPLGPPAPTGANSFKSTALTPASRLPWNPIRTQAFLVAGGAGRPRPASGGSKAVPLGRAGAPSPRFGVGEWSGSGSGGERVADSNA